MTIPVPDEVGRIVVGAALVASLIVVAATNDEFHEQNKISNL